MKITDRIKEGKFLPVDKPDNKFWYDQDTKERYKNNLKSQPNDWYYRNKIITYDVNSDGYRTKEFSKVNWAKSIVIFGCSQVYGVGNAEEETISGFLEEITGIPVINLGVAGSSPTFAIHNAAIFATNYPTPKALVNIWTSPYRCPYYFKDEVLHCGHWIKDVHKIGETWNYTTSHPFSNIMLNAMISREMWKNKCPYYELTSFESTSKILNCDYIKQIDYARDLGHAGKETNKIVSNKIAENIQL
jgi:hypothetical protein